MDSYRAPYKAKHHYWPGLLLMVRFVLYMVFAFNIQEDPKITLLDIFFRSWASFRVPVVQWWGLQEQVYRYFGRMVCS